MFAKGSFCYKGHDKTIVGVDSSAWCRECRKEYNLKYRPIAVERKKQGRYKAWQEKYKSVARNRRLQKEFGITLEQYNAMFEAQKGLCLGCYRHASTLKLSLAVDHNHTTGKIRGLLCSQCNVAIGMSHESPEVLRRLAEYLDLH